MRSDPEPAWGGVSSWSTIGCAGREADRAEEPGVLTYWFPTEEGPVTAPDPSVEDTDAYAPPDGGRTHHGGPGA